MLLLLPVQGNSCCGLMRLITTHWLCNNVDSLIELCGSLISQLRYKSYTFPHISMLVVSSS